MPIYDYRCSDCGTLYDVLHKVREVQADVICPSCGSLHSKKLMSVPNVAMGGSSSKSAVDSCQMGDSCCGGVCSVN